MDRLLIVIAVVGLVAAAVLVRRRRAAVPTAFPARVDPTQLGIERGTGNAVIAFSGPYCHACQEWGSGLDTAGVAYRKIDVLQEAGLARAYGVTHTPVVLVVNRADGRVLQGYDDAPDADSLGRVRQLVHA